MIEPAKGEYKDVFGGLDDVHVFGTNPAFTPLLRIDPFSFPQGIHVLEHLDRLVEIFNVCWPMYAAMPAVLKDAISRSYEDCGWNLTTSENSFGEGLYPSFADVARNVREILDSSEYDAENKGAYKGSLLTRLNSLTNGLNGMMLTSDGVDDATLFDGNTIIDLSRVGSTETKSLFMGLIVLKLQEHRMAAADGMNQPLRHLTVLEEAHNLLKRTSMEQSTEGGNLLGKSVEMLSNSIAEMRTYGEGSSSPIRRLGCSTWPPSVTRTRKSSIVCLICRTVSWWDVQRISTIRRSSNWRVCPKASPRSTRTTGWSL